MPQQSDSGFPPYWDPEPGDILEGLVTNIELVNTSFQDDVPVVEIETEEGDRVAVWCSRQVLATEMRKARPQLDEQLQVRYLGPVFDDEGKLKYHRYKVVNQTTKSEGFDWGTGSQPTPPPLEQVRPDLVDDDPF